MEKQKSYLEAYTDYFYGGEDTFQIVYYYSTAGGAMVGETVEAQSVADAISKAKVTKENNKRLVATDAHIVSA